MQRKPVPLVKEFPWQWNSTYVWVSLLLVPSIHYPSKCEALSGGHNLPVLPQSLELETKDGNTSDLRSERMKTPKPSLAPLLSLRTWVWWCQSERSGEYLPHRVKKKPVLLSPGTLDPFLPTCIWKVALMQNDDKVMHTTYFLFYQGPPLRVCCRVKEIAFYLK